MGEPAEITVIFGDGTVPGEKVLIKPFSRVEAQARGLAAGAKPTASLSGTDDVPILSLGIPKGDKGDRGLRGLQGVQGVPGPKGEPGGSEEAIASYFRSAATRPMAALAELGIPAPYASKSAIEASKPTKVGALAKDLSTGWVWAWDGATWKIWEALDATSQLSWAPGASSRNSERAVKCVVRSGVAMLSADLTKRGAWSYSYWSMEKIYTMGAGITTVASCIGQVIWFSDMWVSASGGLVFLQAHGQGTAPDGEYYSIKVSWPTI